MAETAAVAAEPLRRRLEQAAGRPVALILTSNRSRLLSVRRAPGGVEVRLQRLFVDAGAEIHTLIADFVRGRQVDTRPLNDYFQRHPHKPAPPSRAPRTPRLNPVGRHYDLRPLFDQLNASYFAGRIQAAYGWGPRRRPQPARRRTLGSYSARTGSIRLHPLLDRADVPGEVVAFILYHEMLHADLGIGRGTNGRRLVHSAEFRRRERLFVGLEAVQRWLGQGS